MGLLRISKAGRWSPAAFLLLAVLCTPRPCFPASPAISPDAFGGLFSEAEKARLEGDFEHSIELFQRYLSGLPSGSKGPLAEAHFKLGILFWNTGDIKTSREHFVWAQAAAAGNKSPGLPITESLKIIDLYSAGKQSSAEGNFIRSVGEFEEAIGLSRKISIPDFEIKCARMLSLSKWDLMEYESFYSINKDSLRLTVETKNNKEEAECLNHIGAYFWKTGALASALNYLDKARAKAISFNIPRVLAEASVNLGGLMAELGEYGKSMDYLQEAIEIDRKRGNIVSTAYDLNNLGYTTRLKALNDNDFKLLEKAKSYFEEALKTAREAGVEYVEFYAILNLGTVYSLMNLYDKAAEFMLLAEQYAAKRNDSLCLGVVNNNLGIVYGKMGDTERSMRRFEKAIEVGSRTYAGAYAWETYLEIGNRLREKGRFEDSLKNYESAVSLIENTRSKIVQEELKASYLGGDRRMDVYQNMIDSLARLDREYPGRGYDRKAFHYLEKGKARAFLDSLEVADVDIVKGVDAKLLMKERLLTREISKNYTRLLTAGLSEEDRKAIAEQVKSTEDQLDALKREIRTTSPAYADLKYPSAIEYGQARRLIPDNETVFLAYSLGRDSSWCFLLSRKDLQVFELPGEKEIKDKVIAYRRTLSDPDSRDFAPGRELFQILIPPSVGKRPGNLVIIPDDILTLLPFEALLTGTEPNRWLAETCSISYIPSVSSLQALENRRQSGPSPRRPVFAVGDPIYRPASLKGDAAGLAEYVQAVSPGAGTELERLKFSGLEAGQVNNIFKAGRKDLFLGEKATEDNIKSARLTDYRLIHLAAHAFVDDKNPLRSSIVLTLDGDPAEDGLLQMREIYNLRMNADLVTLSACQTGLGQFIRGEGISGINRAFFYAGASSVCMSFWTVNDEATFQMMERFYTHLRSGLSVNEALHRTKVEMIGSGTLSHPYYWASFIVSGKTSKRVFPHQGNHFLWLAVPLIIGLSSVLTAKGIRSRRGKPAAGQSPAPDRSKSLYS